LRGLMFKFNLMKVSTPYPENSGTQGRGGKLHFAEGRTSRGEREKRFSEAGVLGVGHWLILKGAVS